METRQLPKRSKAQMIRDSDFAQKSTYYNDVLNSDDLVLHHFLENHRKLSDAFYWEALRVAWIVAGSHENIKTFLPFFNSKRPFKYYFMRSVDWNEFNLLPDEIKVYRAVADGHDNGVSWSSSLEFVERYALSLGRKIKERIINKKDVFAYLNSRREHEFIILGGE